MNGPSAKWQADNAGWCARHDHLPRVVPAEHDREREAWLSGWDEAEEIYKCRICGATNQTKPPILPMYERPVKPTLELVWLCADHAKQEQMAGRVDFYLPHDLSVYGGGPDQETAKRFAQIEITDE